MFVDWAALGALMLPVAFAVLGLGHAALRRYWVYKERMAMIPQGLVPPQHEREWPQLPRTSSRSGPLPGILLTVVGLAVTLGLLTLGVGPWLLAGLVPAAIGIALLIDQILRTPSDDAQDDGAGDR